MENMNTTNAIVKVNKPEHHTMLLSDLLSHDCGREGARTNYIHNDRIWELYQNVRTMLAAASNDSQFRTMTPRNIIRISRTQQCAPGWYAILDNTDGIKDHQPGRNLIHVMIPYYDIIDYTDNHIEALKTLGYENTARLSALIHYPDSPLPKATRKQIYQTAIRYAGNNRLPWLFSILTENMGGLTLKEILDNDTMPAEFIRVDSDMSRQRKENKYRRTAETLTKEGEPIFDRLAARLYRNGMTDGGEESLLFTSLLETFGYQPLPGKTDDMKTVNGAYTPTPQYSIIVPRGQTMLAAKRRNPTKGTIQRRLNDLHRIENLPDILLGCFPNRPLSAEPRTGNTGLLLKAEDKPNAYFENNHLRYSEPPEHYTFQEYQPWKNNHRRRETPTRLNWLEHLLDTEDEDEQYRLIMWIRMRQTAVIRCRTSISQPTDPTPDQLLPWIKNGTPPKEISWNNSPAISFAYKEITFEPERMQDCGSMDQVFANLPATVDELQQRLQETGAATGDDLYRMIINSQMEADFKNQL